MSNYLIINGVNIGRVTVNNPGGSTLDIVLPDSSDHGTKGAPITQLTRLGGWCNQLLKEQTGLEKPIETYGMMSFFNTDGAVVGSLKWEPNHRKPGDLNARSITVLIDHIFGGAK